MNLGLAALHAAIEGFFSTLPLSASGHRLAARIWAGEVRDLPACVAVAQLGCAAAISIVTRARLGAAFAEGIRGIARPSVLNEGAGRDAVGLAIAALVGAVGHGVASAWSSPLNEVPTVAGAGLLLTAAALASTAWAPSGLSPERLGPSPWGAMMVGLAYALAVLPGLSAVAAAYVVARWLGIATWRAAETALVVSFPALAFGSIRSLVADGAPFDSAGVAIAAVVAFVAALLAASLWRAICERQRTALLALWLLPLALAILGYGRALPHPTTDLPLSASVP
jgi:undecaprenyl-diphosphatase